MRFSWTRALVLTGLLVVAWTTPGLWRLYAYLRPLGPELIQASVRNLDQLAADPDPSTVRHQVIAAPDSLEFPPALLGLPHSHDLALAAIGLLAILLGLGNSLRRLAEPVTADRARPGGRPRAAQGAIRHLILGLWELLESFALLPLGPAAAVALLASASSVVGGPVSWPALDQLVNPYLQLAASLFTGVGP